MELVGAEVLSLFERFGISDYCLGLNFDGEQRYYTPTGILEAKDVREPTRHGFRLGCMFRPFLAATALELVSARKLELDAPLAEYFPELGRRFRSRDISLRHVISHTVGYMGFSHYGSAHAFPNPSKALSDIRRAPQIFAPGRVYNYEHSTTALLGELIERVTGQDAKALVESMVFDRFDAPDIRSQLTSSRSLRALQHGKSSEKGRSLLSRAILIPDLMSIVDAIMWSSEGGESRFGLSPSTCRLLTSPVISIPRLPGSVAWKTLATGSTTGLHVYRNGVVGYEGSTDRQAIGFRCDPMRKWAVVLGINKPGQEILRRAVFGYVLSIVDDLHDSAASPAMPLDGAHNFSPEEVVGDYFGDKNFYISVRGHSQELDLKACWGREMHSSQRGSIAPGGVPWFDANNHSFEPCFYRLSGKGEVCVVYGMCTLKRHSGWRRAVRSVDAFMHHRTPKG